MKRLSLLSLLCFAVLLAASSSVQADSEDDPPLISIDVENGASTTDTITFTGILEDEVEPSEFFWRVAKNGTAFDGGDLKSSLDEIDSTSSRSQWAWSFDLSFFATGECACYVSLHSKDASGAEKIETRVVFMADENTTHLLGFLIIEDQAGTLVSSSLSISGWIGTYLDDEMTLGIQSSLAQGLITTSHIPEVFACAGSSTAQQVTIISGGDFEIEWDISSKLDGWLDVELMACSLERAFADGASVHYSIRVNNAPPIIKLDGIDSVEETNEWHTFDASLTEDPYWGRTDMYYVWTLRRPSHTGTLPVDVQMGDDLTTYSVSATSSGNFTLSLTVYDQGGLSSTSVVEFDIHNRVPTASLAIDGIAVLDGEEIRLKTPSNTLIDATSSTDTENDAGVLRCIWLFDGIPLYEGCNRDFVWPDENVHRAWLTLEVIDDDGEVATLSVQLVHPDEVKPFPVALIGLVFSALFLTYAIAQRLRGGSEKSIPKWKS
jgi:hypothetical protein